MASCGPPGNRSKILVNCPKCQSNNTFLFFLPWICCPFFVVSSLPCRFFPPNNQQTTEGSIHTSIHLRRFDELRSRYHRNVDGTLLAANSFGRCRQLVEREGFIRGVWVGIWKLMSWMSRNICFFEFLNPFIFVLRKMTSFVSRIQKNKGEKWWSPSWEFKDGPFLFFDLKQSSGKIWKLCAASQSIIMKLDILGKTMRTCSKGVAIYGPFWRVWRKGNSTCMSFLQQTHQALLDSEVWKFQTHPTEICWGSLTTVPNKFHDHSIFFGPTLFVEAHGIPVKNHTNTSGPD